MGSSAMGSSAPMQLNVHSPGYQGSRVTERSAGGDHLILTVWIYFEITSI
jgi:hypothetical protein